MRWICAGLCAILFPAFCQAEERIVASYTNTDFITNVTAAGDNIWCGTWEGGAARYNRKDGSWKVFTSIDGLVNNSVGSIYVDRKGRVWFPGNEWGISCFDGSSWTRYRRDGGWSGSGLVRSVCEDTGGRMWCNTTEGVYYLNGTVWTLARKGGAGAIAAGKDGSVWCAQNNMLVRYDGTEWREFTAQDTGIEFNYIHSLLFDRNNVLWVRLWGGDVACYDGETWMRPALPKGSGSSYSFPIICPLGYVWMVWEGNICRFGDANKWEIKVPAEKVKDAFSAAGLTVPGEILFQADNRGVFWLADSRVLDLQQHIPGLFRFDGMTLKIVRRECMAFRRPTAVAQDRSGAIWTAGLYGRGVSRFDGSQWKSFTGIPGVPYYEFTGMAVDEKNNVWCAAPFGALRYDGSGWNLYNNSNSGLKYDAVTTLYLDSKGVVWFGARGGVVSYDGSLWKTYDKSTTGLDLSGVVCISGDGSGALFAGGDSLLVRFDGTVWKNYTLAPEGWALNLTLMAKAPNGDLWCVGNQYEVKQHYNSSTLLFHFNGTSWEHFPVQSVSALTVDARGLVWIGSSDKGGVSSFDGSEWAQYEYETGLATHVVHTIFVDRNNVKWIGTEDGMFCIGESAPNGIGGTSGASPSSIALTGHPNPFNSSAVLEFILAVGGRTELAVYTVTGQKVRTLHAGNLPPGRHAFVWDGRDDSGRFASSGVFIVRCSSGKAASARKILMMK